ncbi:MAG: type II toxin-antitoxin system RelE/ParE family toxin [Magnetococcales bacterium]|nr:type II toxin-antitoxin system RelE/ParE family toxin [Magnetococcales bacterium]
MAGDYILSGKADDDLSEIYLHTHRHFGEAQADAYLMGLDACFRNLAGQPGMGRSVNDLREGYLRWDHERHAIFYKLHPDGIVIMRVLHGVRNLPPLLDQE